MAYEYQRTDWNNYDPNLTLEENMKRNAVATEELLDKMDEGIYQANKPYEVGTVTVADEDNEPSVNIVYGEEKRVFNFVLPAGQKGDPGEAGADGANGADGKSAYTIALENGFIGTEEEWLATLKGEQGDAGTDGADGKSAYEVAKANGFEGTEEEWLASLKGVDGKSNFDIAVEEGFEGTKEEWLNQIKAEKGEKGDPGADGKSAYEIAKEETGFSGTAVEWIASLKGEQGDPGKDGVDGEQGVPGEPGKDGKTVYDLAVEEGYDGTLQEWLASLKGADGKTNYELAVENGFEGTLAEWLETIQAEKGEKGDPGEPGVAGAAGVDGRDGADGKSAYDIAVENGFDGDETAWLESLKGADGAAGENGADGTNGTDGVNGADGADGKSAYDIAVENGFDGDETAWLESLKGEKGEPGEAGSIGFDGKSAYEVAKANGFEGTEAEWLATLKGEQGEKGDEAKISDIANSYQEMIDAWDTYAVNDLILIVDPDDKEHNASIYAKKLGEEPKFVSKLEAVKGDKGDQGDPGTPGTNGVDGRDGADGKSAYDIAVENGLVTGDDVDDEAAWIRSLKGAKGDAGKSAYDIAVDDGFTGTQEEWLNSFKGEAGAAGNKWVVATEALEAGATAPEGAEVGDLVLDQDGDVYQVAEDGTLPEVLVHLKGAKGDAGDGSSAAALNLEIGDITSGETPSAAFRKDEETGVTYLDIIFPIVPVLPVVWKGEITIPAAGWVESETGFTNEVAVESVTVDNQIDINDSTETTEDMTRELTDCNVTAIEQKEGAIVFGADTKPTIDIVVFVTTTTEPSTTK